MGDSTYVFEDLSKDRSRNQKPMRLALATIEVLCVAIALGFLFAAGGGLHDSLQWLVVSVVEAGCVFLGGLLTYVLWNTRQAPIRLDIGPQGLSLRWPSGYAEELAWEKVTRRFVLLDYSANPRVIRMLPRFQWELRRFNRPATSLSKEAFDAIIAGARSRGLLIDSRSLPNPGWGWASCTAIRIRSIPSA